MVVQDSLCDRSFFFEVGYILGRAHLFSGVFLCGVRTLNTLLLHYHVTETNFNGFPPPHDNTAFCAASSGSEQGNQKDLPQPG